MQRDRAYLIVLAGSNVGEMYRLEDAETVIGRGADATIRLNDDGISRRHARISSRTARCSSKTSKSANGTLVNGEPIAQCSSLKDGDKIQLGSTTILKFTYHDQLEESFQQQMYDAALRDGLTKAFNKKYFLDRLRPRSPTRAVTARTLSLLMFDVDHFKSINDTHGHLAGDFVLAKLSQSSDAHRAHRGRLRPLRRRGVLASSAAASARSAACSAERLRAPDRVDGVRSKGSGSP